MNIATVLHPDSAHGSTSAAVQISEIVGVDLPTDTAFIMSEKGQPPLTAAGYTGSRIQLLMPFKQLLLVSAVVSVGGDNERS